MGLPNAREEDSESDAHYCSMLSAVALCIANLEPTTGAFERRIL